MGDHTIVIILKIKSMGILKDKLGGGKMKKNQGLELTFEVASRWRHTHNTGLDFSDALPASTSWISVYGFIYLHMV